MEKEKKDSLGFVLGIMIAVCAFLPYVSLLTIKQSLIDGTALRGIIAILAGVCAVIGAFAWEDKIRAKFYIAGGLTGLALMVEFRFSAHQYFKYVHKEWGYHILFFASLLLLVHGIMYLPKKKKS